MKYEKKSAILKKTITHILHNNNAKKLLTNSQKKNSYLINNQVTHPFDISNEFIDFLESIWIFSIFFYVFELYVSGIFDKVVFFQIFNFNATL